MRCLIPFLGAATRHSIFFADVSRAAELACLGAAYDLVPLPASCALSPRTPQVDFSLMVFTRVLQGHSQAAGSSHCPSSTC